MKKDIDRYSKKQIYKQRDEYIKKIKRNRKLGKLDELADLEEDYKYFKNRSK